MPSGGRAALMAMTPEQRKANRRLGLILLSIALVFGLGFVTKMVLLAH